MTFIYPALFHHEDDSYWVEFPDLEGCFSDGDTIAEAMANAQESLSGYLLSRIDHNLSIPDATSINDYKVSDGFASLVLATIDPYKDNKAIKKTLTIPSWMNDKASTMNINFSKVLQEALMAKFS